ncbi:MAG: hypothetical protein HRU71_00405 [Planctomycetia bacterium]|nr:MAG: hypothetical protein HRU71_00405 [Planctomycetia bacterium]
MCGFQPLPTCRIPLRRRAAVRGSVPALLLIVISHLPAARGEERAITELVPADALIMYCAKPYTWLDQPIGRAEGTTQPTGTAASIASIVSVLNTAGLIPAEGQVFADIAGALPLLAQFEHTLALLDVSSRIVEQPQASVSRAGGEDVDISLRLRNMQAAMIFRTQGRHQVVIDQLRRVTGRYTNNEVAKLEKGEIQGVRFDRLVDSRLPGWAVWEWGQVGEFFVISFGADAFVKVAGTASGKHPSMNQDAWYRKAFERTDGERAFAHWLIAFMRLEEALGPQAGGRFEAVTQALQAADLDRDLWTIGADGKRLSCHRCYQKAGRDVVQSYSNPQAFSQDHLRIVPKEAEHIAVISVPTSWLVDNVPRGWLAAQSISNVQKWRRAWRQLERDSGVDIGGNLISHFGQTVVLYDYPPHPLKIPFAFTLAIEIDDAKAVKAATDALLDAWTRYLDERAERNKTTLVRIKVRRDPDNVWYLQAGILGPAMKVMDRYVLISWSPQALRECVEYIEQHDKARPKP